jgi:branched-chain amino acid transport system substrate-binding protein
LIEPRFGRACALFLTIGTLSVQLAACAGSTGSSKPSPESAGSPATVSSTLPEGAGFAREIEKMIASGDVDRAARMLRDEREGGSKSASAAELRLAEGEIARARGELDAAAVAYAGVESAPGGVALAGAAWERIGAVHGARKETAEELRALLKSRDLLDPRARAGVESRIAAIVSGLSPQERDARARAFPGAGIAPKSSSRTPSGSGHRVVLLAPLSGRFEHFGKAFELGARIALDERRKDALPAIELVVRDAPSDPIATQASAREAALEDGCVAIIGPILSMPIVAAASVAESFRVPLLAPAVTESRLASIGGTVFSLDPSPRELARVLAQASIESAGLRSFVVVTPDDARSSARAVEFAREAGERGGKIAATIRYEPGKKDYRVALADVKKAPCDAVYILGEPADLEIFAKQIDGVKLERPVLGHGEWADDRIQGFGRASLEGAIVVLEEGENPESEFRKKLEKSVRERAGGELSRFHVYGYEAMSEILAAFDRGARDADTLIEILRGRSAWDIPPAGREIQAWTRRDGALRPFADR